MAASRGGDVVIAAGPTELKRYFPISLLATAIVAGVPLWTVFGFGQQLGLFATLLSVVLSFGLAQLGNVAWKRWPGSRDVVFNDLMLWGFARRMVTQRRLIRRVERLGFSVRSDPDDLTIEERTYLLKKLAEGLETGDPYTHGHSQRVARHAYMVAKTMKLTRRQAEKIRLAAVIHDVGKLRIPREIITKPGQLTDEEFDIVKRHTVDGAAMVEVLRDPEVTDIVRHHHERLDGSGYPDKLPASEISIGARVVAVADTFDAVSSLRPYRSARKHKVALDILEEDARAGRLDPDVVEAFVRYYSGRRALRWWAFLSAGPAYLYEVPIALVHRAGAAGLANAAIVAVAAITLAPGSPLHTIGDQRNAERRERAAAVQELSRRANAQASRITAASRRDGASATATKTDRRSDEIGTKPKAKKRGLGASAEPGGNSRAGENDRPEKEPRPQDEPSSDGDLAGAVDGSTGDTDGSVKNGSSDDAGDLVEDTTDTITTEVDTAPAANAPENAGGKETDK